MFINAEDIYGFIDEHRHEKVSVELFNMNTNEYISLKWSDTVETRMENEMRLENTRVNYMTLSMNMLGFFHRG